MNLRRKTLLLIAQTQIIMIVIIMFSSQIIFLDNYMVLERNEAAVNAKRGLSAISNIVAELSNKAYDWAQWDDTYTFIQNTNPEYLHSNMVDSTFTSLKVNVIVFVNSTGDVIYGKAFSFENNAEVAIPQELLDEVSHSDTLWNHTTIENRVTGVIPLTDIPLLVASRPITTSRGEGPIRGAVIMGLFLDTQIVEQISESVALPVAIVSSSDLQAPYFASQTYSSSELGESPVFVHVPKNNSISGFGLIKDIHGVFAFTLTVESPMNIYMQGQNSVYFFLLLYITSGLTIGLVTVVLLEKGLLARIDRLSLAIKNMGKSKSLSNKLAWQNKDEFSLLANAIDSMVEERFNTIGEFAGMIGHDLRNPLTGIAGATYYLKKKYSTKLDEKGKEMLAVIEQDVEFSNKIINDLLEYSRNITLELSSTTPRAILGETLARLEIPKNITLIDNTETSPLMKVDRTRIQRVFMNIMKNAFDAMPEGGKLTITNRMENNKVSFDFQDTGTGISEAAKERIFEPLYTTKAKGMGFGLAICKRMVEAHGGTISVVSVVGNGSTFTVSLPVEPASKG